MSNSKLSNSIDKNTEAKLDEARAEEMLKPIQGKNGETITTEQIAKMREDGLKKAEKNKGKSVEQQDIIGAKEYQKAEEKLREGDIIGSMKLQAYAALGAYGPAKRNAAITKFGSGILASSCTGWAGFLLKVANSSGLTDRLIQNFTGSEEADKIVDAQGQGAQVAAPKLPNNQIMKNHLAEHSASAQQSQVDSLTPVAAAQKQGGRA